MHYNNKYYEIQMKITIKNLNDELLTIQSWVYSDISKNYITWNEHLTNSVAPVIRTHDART